MKSSDIVHYRFDNFFDMKEYVKDRSLYYHYRFGADTFGGKFDIYKNQNFELLKISYFDGIMYSGHSPKGTLSLFILLDNGGGTLYANKKFMQDNEIIVYDDYYEYEISFSRPIKMGIVSMKKEFVTKSFPFLYEIVGKTYIDYNHILRDLFLYMDKEETNNFIYEDKLKEFMKFLFTNINNDTVKKLTKSELLVFEIRDYLVDNLEKKELIKEMASHFGISERTLQIKFKKIFGLTPKKFIKLLKLNLAHEEMLLSKDQKKVSEIAMELGFENFGRFSKEYKKLYGKLPSEIIYKYSQNKY